MRVCLPGSAVCDSLEYLPTPSRSVFFSLCVALAVFIVVDLARMVLNAQVNGERDCSSSSVY